MRRKDESKKPIIADFINAFYYEHDKVPSVRAFTAILWICRKRAS